MKFEVLYTDSNLLKECNLYTFENKTSQDTDKYHSKMIVVLYHTSSKELISGHTLPHGHVHV